MAAEYWKETGLTMEYKMREDGTASVPSSLLKIASGFETQKYVVVPKVFSERLKSDYRYSKDIVYNNFPWPMPTDE